MDADQKARFIEVWGRMGTVWGINNSTARVHALLMASDDALSLDDIARKLRISRGNASMCLRELRNWGVIQRIKQPGDRRDYYVTEQDVWKMFFAIVRERKRRELDPVLEVVREIVSKAPSGRAGRADDRFRQMAEFLGTLDVFAGRFLADEGEARSILAFLAGRGPGRPK